MLCSVTGVGVDPARRSGGVTCDVCKCVDGRTSVVFGDRGLCPARRSGVCGCVRVSCSVRPVAWTGDANCEADVWRKWEKKRCVADRKCYDCSWSVSCRLKGPKTKGSLPLWARPQCAAQTR